ncbi:NAD(P)-dependent oxidoreductase [Magnetospirillum sp. 64-120]|uniref:NAD-dependent epimerase/dehydratase family protein n=1 Tax=Magnetospirillum sp. 64-120 TaxID=1895778 RepID=UPI0009289F85|nr:NAD(P)-dependent oxidoreductase [Magnetospirillum sp. 64-120]OJX75922.1 MAG: hypothetical protein BGO92_15265 [Magnetospirillum sp. 64-120]
MTEAPLIVVTGASSFIGRHVVRELAKRYAAPDAPRRRIIATVRTDNPPPFPDNVDVRRGALDDPSFLASIPGEVEAVLHVAATSPKPNVPPDAAGLVRDNITATQLTIDWALARAARRFLFTSSLSVHGTISDTTVSPTTDIVNPALYGITKRVGECLLDGVAGTLPSIAIRLPGIVGRGADRIWLSGLAQKLSANQPVTIFNPDAPFNNILHAEDLAVFLADLTAAELQGASAFPIGAGTPLTVGEVVHTFRDRLGSFSEIQVDPSHRPSFTLCNRAAEAFGYRPTTTRDALERYSRDLRSS